MKNFKDITLSIFAIIGFLTILSSFNNQTQQTHSTVPESHIWEMYSTTGNTAFALNKVTGEVRKYSGTNISVDKTSRLDTYTQSSFAVMVERKQKE